MTYWIVMRLCKWEDLVAQEAHGLFPGGRVQSGPHGEFGYLPVFHTREQAEAASDGGKYPVEMLTTKGAT